MPKSKLAYISAVASLFLLGAATGAADPEAPGLPNFHQVDDHVYRGAQPTAVGWKTLAGLGIKTVIDLRREGEDGEHSTRAEAQAVEAAGMHYINVPLNGLRAPSGGDIAKVLALMKSKEPVFVHCRQGKDRTGTVVACYRIAHDSWPNRKALLEAKELGMHWFEGAMRHYISTFGPTLLEAEVGPNSQLTSTQH